MTLCTEAIALAPSPVAAATPLHRAGADVTDREHARHAGLERQGPSSETGPGGAEVAVGQLGVGPDETVGLGGDPSQPARQSAAWPAELAPPTTATGLPVQLLASSSVEA